MIFGDIVWYAVISGGLLSFWFLLEEKFTAPSVLHAVDRLGSEAVVTTGSTYSRERARGGGGTDFQGAGRVCRQETAIQQSRNPKTANYKVVIITMQKWGSVAGGAQYA